MLADILITLGTIISILGGMGWLSHTAEERTARRLDRMEARNDEAHAGITTNVKANRKANRKAIKKVGKAVKANRRAIERLSE